MGNEAMKRILIVDDEQPVLTSFSYLLKTDGVEVVACTEIEQAEAALNGSKFDLVLADVRMSGVNGIEGLELLSYIKQNYDTNVIIMTGYGTPEMEEEAYRRGASCYFTKPVDIRQLLEQVAKKGIPVKSIPA